MPTFEMAARECHAYLKGIGRSGRANRFVSLEKHVFPALGLKRVDQVEASDIRDMLAPIWAELSYMSRKVRGRVATVLNYAHSKGCRASEAPSKSVTMGLARQKLGGNYAAMPYTDVPAFVAALSSKTDTVGRKALLFAILTAARSGEVRHAMWSHIDLDRKLWIRPAELMTARKDHSVTLSDEAVGILQSVAKLRVSEADALVFPSAKQTPLSDMTLSKIMRDAKLPYTVHGFRSSFRDWAAELMPTIPDSVAEAAHVVPDKVVAAYKRTAFIECAGRC